MKHEFSGFWRRAKDVLLWAGSSHSERHSHRGRSLAYEPLEPRIVLAAAGLVDVGAQPVGELSGKIVYTHAGHGITGDHPSAGDWSFQRDLDLNMIEDLGNQDQMTFFADYLFRAGATVVPLRPVGHQSNEVVLDNDDLEVTFSGSWSNSSSSIYFGDAGDVPYRFASTSATETAFARYQPNIPEAGFYPVYAWTSYGANRATDQLYRINHSGGTTEVTVNHRRVGNGTVYLGTYYFDAGTDGYVDISNRSNDAGSIVVADMIRFGNGVGDITNSFGATSGRDREDEAGLYWVEWHVEHSQGIPDSEYRTTSDDRDATVRLSPKYAEYMNREADGSLSDRVFISFHSNGSVSGNARGVVSLFNSGSGSNTATPNQVLLASLTASEVNDDLVDQAGFFEHDWFDRSTHTLGSSFGEIDNREIGGEFDATIVETAFHDNLQDAQLLRDGKVLDAVARATYQGVVKFFNNIDGGATQVVMLPGQVEDVRAETIGSGSVTVSWATPAANTYNGDAATGYMVYGSTDGYGFDGGTFVAGGGSTSHTFNGLDINEGAYYFKVAAVNTGGECKASEVVAAIPNAGAKDILIVNGFDRLTRQLNPVQAGAERVRPRQSNSFDYAVQIASAIEANSPDLVVDTASNEAVIAGDVNLGDYSAVFWILGEESTADSTFDATEQGLVSGYLGVGGQLFVSGAEIGWDLDSQGGGQSFYNNSLRAGYVADDAATYDVQGVGGSIFDGLSFSFDDGSQFYDVNFPDVISPLGGATTALNYVGGTGGGAAIQYDSGGSTKVVNLAFPFETITDQADRNDVMSRVLSFFSFDVTFSDFEAILDNDDGAPIYTETGSWMTQGGGLGYNGLTYQFKSTGGSPATAQWQFTLPFAGQGEVEVIYSAGSNRATSTVYEIETGNGTELANINQKINDLTWVSLGTFDFTAGSHNVLLDAQASTGGSVVVADAVRVFIAAPTTETGDFNSDGSVNGFDFLAWQRGFGTTGGATLPQGDGNADGNVDGDDLTIWESQYGTTSLLASSESFSTELALAVTAEPTFVASPATFESDNPVALASVAQFVSLSNEKSESLSAGVIESTEHVEYLRQGHLRHEHRRLRFQDGVSDRHTLFLERLATRLEHRPKGSDYNYGAWQEAFAEIGEDKLFDSHLFEM